MVTMRDRALIEAQGQGHRHRRVAPEPVRPAGEAGRGHLCPAGISIFLLIYYTAVGFGLIYFTTVFGFSVKDGNGLGNWNWGFNVVAVVLSGFVSDKLPGEKAVHDRRWRGASGDDGALPESGRAPHTSYYHLAACRHPVVRLGVAYVPWMASFTETVEARTRHLRRPAWPSGAGSSGSSYSCRT